MARLSDFFVGALFLSLTLWAFGVASTQYRWQIGAMTLSISPILIALMIAFFLCAFFLPYLAGWKRAKRWRRYLASRQRYWTDELTGACAFPDQATAVARLRQLQQTLGDESRDFADRQPGVRLGLELERLAEEPLPHALQQVQQAYRLSRPHDPRFAHVDFLEGLRGEIEHAATQLEKLPTHEAAMQRAKEYAAHYRERRNSIAAETTMREEGRPLVLAAVGFVLSGLASTLFSEAGKWMWGAVVGTLASGHAG